MKTQSITASELKTHCLRLLNEINKRNTEIIITKRGKPLAKLVPTLKKTHSLYGCMKGNMIIRGNIVSSTNEAWEADAHD